jgi:hypothetical protein
MTLNIKHTAMDIKAIIKFMGIFVVFLIALMFKAGLTYAENDFANKDKLAEQINQSEGEAILSFEKIFDENVNIIVPILPGFQQVESRYKYVLTFVSNPEVWKKFIKKQKAQIFTEDLLIFVVGQKIFTDMQEARDEVLMIIGDGTYPFGDIPDTYIGFRRTDIEIFLYGTTKIKGEYISALLLAMSEYFSNTDEEKYKKMMRDWMVKARKRNLENK